MCDADEDMDGIPDEALTCTGDPRCAKVKRFSESSFFIILVDIFVSLRLSDMPVNWPQLELNTQYFHF